MGNERTFPAAKAECDCEKCLKKIKLSCGRDGIWYPDRSKRGRTGGRWNPVMPMTFADCNLNPITTPQTTPSTIPTTKRTTLVQTTKTTTIPTTKRTTLVPTTKTTTIPTTKRTTLVPTTKTTPIPTTKRTTLVQTTKTTTIPTTKRTTLVQTTKTTPIPTTTTTILTTLKRISTTPTETTPTTTSTTQPTITSTPSTEPTTLTQIEVTARQEATELRFDVLPIPLQSIFKQVISETTLQDETTSNEPKVETTTTEKSESTSKYEESTTEKMQESSIHISETITTLRPHFDDDEIESSSSTSMLDLAATETSVTTTVVIDKSTEISTISSEIHDTSETTRKTDTETTEDSPSVTLHQNDTDTTEISAIDLAHSSEIPETYTTEGSSFNDSYYHKDDTEIPKISTITTDIDRLLLKTETTTESTEFSSSSIHHNDTETSNIPEISTITTIIHDLPTVSEVPETTTIHKHTEISTVDFKIPIVTETYITELITQKKLEISTELPETVTDTTDETEMQSESNLILYYALLSSFILIICLIIIAVCIKRLKQRKSIDVSHLYEPEIYPLKGSPNLSFTNKLSELTEIQLKCMTDDDDNNFQVIKIPGIRKSIS
ncbi:hypothetical protein B566_EDAN005190 [Ephemera danica]|nr:hypothetical protein B566_EDAN005190 [Ephemera danica]